ncbi:MAG: ribbon-helix-helix protein, CopG family [Chloroflexi bacterium]|nr:ribbon-helix-helix protein, CopG family [Chloroflexota bacterium]
MCPKISVSLPQEILQELDKAAVESQISRSALIARALKRHFEEKKKRQLAAAASIDRFREKYGGWDGTAEVLKWRDRQ